MSRLKQLVLEVHRRSLWQVLAVYVGASWAVLEATDQVQERFLMPDWVYGAAWVVLLVGFPIVLASALVREETAGPARQGEPADRVASPAAAAGKRPVETERAAGGGLVGVVARRLTRGRAVLAVVVALALVGLAGALVVVRGAARVTEAHGAAGDAFEERAWLVVAGFEAPAGEEDLGRAVRTALMTELGQSRYVNVYGDNQVRPVLGRMMLPDTAPLTERLALELAQREGLAAVLAGSVHRVGGGYQLSARVVEPGSGRELIGVTAAAGSDRLLEGIEDLSRQVRARLGESGAALRQSLPLPRVTTRSLEALRKYDLAVAAQARGDQQQTLALAEEAIQLDSSFAAAYRLSAVASQNLGWWTAAVQYATRAYELREQATDRERLLVEASYYWYAELDPRAAADAYELLLAQYPDDATAANNLAVMAGTWLGELQRAYPAALKSVELEPYSVTGYGSAIEYAWEFERWDAADSLIDLARERGFGERAVRWSRAQALGRGDWGRAEALCDSLLAEPASPGWLASDQRACGSIDIARGHIRRAIERLLPGAAHAMGSGSSGAIRLSYQALAWAEASRGRPEAAGDYLAAILDYMPADSLDAVTRHVFRNQLRFFAGLLGRLELAERFADVYWPHPDSAHPGVRWGEGLGGGGEALARGDPEAALDAFAEIRDTGLLPRDPVFRLGFGLTYAELGQADSAVAHLESVIRPAAIAGSPVSLTQLPAIERRLAELEESRGDIDAAIRHYGRFIELWSDADPELQYQVDAARRALARLSAIEND
ncbi:MAG: hypothetical protein PVG79_01405 [Gemmatimonadales bacterium]